MKQWRLFFLFLFLTGTAAAQTTSVSGTITDGGGQTWNNGTYTFTFYPSPANPLGPYFQNGTVFNINTTISGSLSGIGTLNNVPVPDNLTITPSGSLWTVKVCPASTSVCYQTNLTITSPNQNISSTVVPPAAQVFVNAPPTGYAAYSDSEIQGARQGSFYTNLVDGKIHYCSTVAPCTWIAITGTPVQLAGSPNTNSVTANASVTTTQGLQVTCSTPPCFAAGSLNTFGKTFNASWGGTIQTVNSTETVQWIISLDGGVNFRSVLTTYVPAGTSSSGFQFTIVCTVTTTGSSGQANCMIGGYVGDGTNNNGKSNALAGFVFYTPLNLTAAITPVLGVSFTTASTANVAISNYAISHQEN